MRYEAGDGNAALRAVLLDILATPVSPELLPASESGEIAQQTESLVGPYELHDFYLYYVLRFGFGPAKIYRLARHALGDRYPDDVLLHWLKNFYRRFFAQQFKRSCLPDGPKIGSVTLAAWRLAYAQRRLRCRVAGRARPVEIRKRTYICTKPGKQSFPGFVLRRTAAGRMQE